MTCLPRLPAKCGSGESTLEGRPLPSSPAGIPSAPPRPILMLQGPQATLYVELIQAPSHKPESDAGSPSDSPRPQDPQKAAAMLWVRPLLLQQGSQVWNLQATPDLLWPAAPFTPAYAEEVLPLLGQAREPRPDEVPARQRLQEFLRQAWEHPHSPIYSLE